MPRVSRDADVGNDVSGNRGAQVWPTYSLPAANYDEEVQVQYGDGGESQQPPYVDPPAAMPAYGYAQQPIPPSTSNWLAPPPGLPIVMAGRHAHMQQPAAASSGQWHFMPAPHPVPGCPPGLEYLMTLDQIHVRQKVHMIESFIAFEKANKYMVVNAEGQFMYLAAEMQDYVSQSCFGKERPFEMGVYDHMQRQVMHIARPWACQACYCACFGLQRMEVQAPPGNPIGFIEQEFSIVGIPKYRILNARHEIVLRVQGPWMPCGGNVDFQVTTPDGKTVVGQVTKQWSGFLQEYMTDADNFAISFPLGLDVNVKATLLAMCILIDFNHFEQAAKNE
ncbi:hypothetical protein RvY_03382-1 [Ramazzottius varieornatus]|uniref:Phospholipid scramblase n=1 Tax=Ramazzottius varieornatus TaxID=947166 RepID=A0A1D1UX89_RAMVA|nr:hypothetical protein RvY_03382-1 [Ramazzottius varieornatus]